MKLNKLYLKEKKEESVRRYHPWIFSGAIDRADGAPQEGELVEVYDSRGNFLAIGHCQIGTIAVRILTFTNEPIDHAFWCNRFRKAYQLRNRLGLITDTNNTYRLVHGEGDGMPGLIADMYAGTVVMQAHSVGMHLIREELVSALSEVLGEELRHVYYKSETTLPFKAELEAENGYLKGGENVSAIALENGLKFRIDWLKGQKTGFFVDQRDSRSLLERYAGERKVLNMFCYTGGFSCYALRGNARTVHSVDSSSKAVSITDENVALNFPGDTRHTSFTDDAFRFMEKMEDDYDLIVLDPPAFAKHRNQLKNALRGYQKLNAAAFSKIKPGGILFTFSCSQVVTKENFRLAIFSAAAQSKRSVRILHQITQSPDHPIDIYHPEGEYIKGLVLYVE